jgi:tetratricopeptide (TPR) repeat protein
MLKRLLFFWQMIAVSACFPLAAQANWQESFDEGERLYNHGELAQAEKKLDVALQDAGKFGPKDLRMAATLNDLAMIYDQTKRFKQAEEFYKRSLQIREGALGKTHEDVATSYNNLANLYKDLGRYADAEPLYKRAIEIYSLKNNKSMLAGTYHNYASLRKKEGKTAEAIAFYRKSLDYADQSIGPDNPRTVDIVTKLADLYSQNGRAAEAKPLYGRYLRSVAGLFNLDMNNPGTPLKLHVLAEKMKADGMADNAAEIEKALTATAAKSKLSESH